MSRRLAAVALATLFLSATDLAAQACVGGARLGASTRMAYGAGILQSNDAGTSVGAALGFARQDKVVAGTSVDFSSMDGMTSVNLNFLVGPVQSQKDDKGICLIAGIGASNLGDFDVAGGSRLYIGGSYGVERQMTSVTLVPFGALSLESTDYAGTLDIETEAVNTFVLEGGSGFRFANGMALTASLRAALGENSDVGLRVVGTLPFWRGAGFGK